MRRIANEHTGPRVWPIMLLIGAVLSCAEEPVVTAPEVKPSASLLSIKLNLGGTSVIADAGGPYSGTAGTPITFRSSATSDPLGLLMSYTWYFGDGGTRTGQNVTYTYSTPGTYTVTLRVTALGGVVGDSDQTTATIAPRPNQAPVANASGPYTGTVGAPVAFDGSRSSDPDGNLPLVYSWSFGDGSRGSGANPTHTYAAAGRYTVTLTVTDARGKTSRPDTTSATIAETPTGENKAPVAEAGGPYHGTAGTAITFDGRGSSDPDGHVPLTYAWTFGDGASGTGATPSHIYTTAGTHTVTLTVTDANGRASAPDSAAVTVGSPSSTILVSDDFSRVVAEGWGEADIGGHWSVGEAGPVFHVDGSRGVIEVSSTVPQNVVGRDLQSYGMDVTGLVSFSIDRAPDVASRFHTVQVYARRDDRVSDGDNYYRFRVRVLGSGAMDVRIEKNVNGVVSFVTPANEPVDATFSPGAKYWIRWEAFGTSPATTLRLRVWQDGTAEPTTWHASAVIDEPALDVSGSTGIRYQAANEQVTWPVRLFIDHLRYSIR